MTIKTAHSNCLSLILSTFKMRVAVYNVHLTSLLYVHSYQIWSYFGPRTQRSIVKVLIVVTYEEKKNLILIVGNVQASSVS